MTLSHYLESKLDPVQFDCLTRKLYKIRNRKTVLYDGTGGHIQIVDKLKQQIIESNALEVVDRMARIRNLGKGKNA